jgi:hypothetical protein
MFIFRMVMLILNMTDPLLVVVVIMFKDNRHSPYTPVRLASAASYFSLSLSAAVSVDSFRYFDERF